MAARTLPATSTGRTSFFIYPQSVRTPASARVNPGLHSYRRCGVLNRCFESTMDFHGAECGGDGVEVGAAGGAGEGDADELGGLADRARVGVGVLLELLGVRGEAVLGGESADLVEPFP